MNRFSKRRRFSALLSGRVLSAAIFLCVIGAFLAGLSSLSRVTDSQEREGLENSILQSAVHCYALEGFYPDNLTYLQEHYGLQYDSSKYLVIYEVVGSNLMPDVSVIARPQ